MAGVAGVAALLVAGCGDDSARPGGFAETPTLELKPVEKTGTTTAFDECGLVTPAEIAASVGVDAMYVTGRSAMTQSDGSRRASCSYFPEDVPGMLGMELSTVADTDAERFFAPFAENFTNVGTLEQKLGDRTEVVTYKADGTATHFVEVRTLAGDRGLHFYYTYSDDGGAMPKADGKAAALILASALERLPATVTVPDGTPEGPCADLDLASANKTLGGELVMTRSVVSEEDAARCYFSGDGASLEVIVLTDPDRAGQAAAALDPVTHPDIGDGARLTVTNVGLNARVRSGEHVVVITGTYQGSVTALRPADVDLVRGIADTVSKGD